MYMAAASASIQQRSARQNGIAGLILLFASITFLADLFWLMSAGQLFMLQLPILLLCFVVITVYGLGYILSPPNWLILTLFTLLYLLQDATLRESGGGLDIQTVFKGGLAFSLLALSISTGLRASFQHPILTVWLGYCIFALASAAYSSTVILAIGSGIALVAVGFSSARIATSDESILAIQWRAIYWSCLIVSVASLLLWATFPSAARDISVVDSYRLKGITGSGNSLGPMAGIGIIASIMMLGQARNNKWRIFHLLAILICVGTLAATKSRSSMIGVVVSFFFVYVIQRRHTIWATLTALLFGTLALIPATQPKAFNAILLSISGLVSRSGDVAELTTFTGRSDIWRAARSLVYAKPWIGYGLGSTRVELPKAFSDAWGNTYSSAHNFILESMINVGLIGTSMLVGTFVWATVGLIRHAQTSGGQQPPAQITALRCLIFLWLQSSMEKSLAGTMAPTTVILGLCIATYAHTRLQERTPGTSSLTSKVR